jgi:hypothetical protein
MLTDDVSAVGFAYGFVECGVNFEEEFGAGLVILQFLRQAVLIPSGFDTVLVGFALAHEAPIIFNDLTAEEGDETFGA